jgi:hypothetical protein
VEREKIATAAKQLAQNKANTTDLATTSKKETTREKKTIKITEIKEKAGQGSRWNCFNKECQTKPDKKRKSEAERMKSTIEKALREG